jgi:hypothetical protein
LDLVCCPHHLEPLIHRHRHAEPLWGYTTVLMQDGVIFENGAEAGKQAMCKLLRDGIHQFQLIPDKESS